jgi:hypothetical protein
MGLLSQQLADDAAWMMGDLDAVPGAETITYTPHNGTPRTIVAIVDRNPPEPVDSRALKPSMRVTVANHATLGILLTTFNAGGDYITLGTDTGDTATKIYLHAKPTFQDEGMLTFEI